MNRVYSDSSTWIIGAVKGREVIKLTNSKAKGKRGELEWAKFCRDQGYNVRRTQQYAGGTKESADCVGLPYVHQEVKRWAVITSEQIKDFLRQAITDSTGSDNIPIVAYREDYGKWQVAMEWADFVKMYTAATDSDADIIEDFPSVEYVTMPATDWFKLYREYEAGRSLSC